MSNINTQFQQISSSNNYFPSKLTTDLLELSDSNIEIISGGGNQYPPPQTVPILTIKWRPILF